MKRTEEPDPTAQLFAFCKRCKTLYLGVKADVMICPCGRLTGRFRKGFKLGIETQREPHVECPTEYARKTVIYR